MPIYLALIDYKLVSEFRHCQQSETELYLDRYRFEEPLWSRAFTTNIDRCQVRKKDNRDRRKIKHRKIHK